MTYAQLKDVQPAQFDGAADGWRKVSSAAGAAMDRVNNEIAAKLRGELRGQAVDAALTRLRRVADNFQYTHDQTNMARSALSDFAEELRAAKRKLDGAVADAQGAGFSVETDGSVKWTAADSSHEESKKTEAQGYADRLSGAVRDATTADGTCTGLLNRLKARNDLTVTDADWADSGRDRAAAREALGDDVRREDIPKDKSPRENAQWWRGLSPEEQADFLALYPDAVGALDGLP
ncbi:MAG: alpha/beta hydrolase, partial [Streptomyces sp.]